MTQDINNPSHFIADEGKVFQRVYNGFTAIEKPYVVGSELIIGKILVDNKGHKLDNPINDDIHYYEEITAPEPENKEESVED